MLQYRLITLKIKLSCLFLFTYICSNLPAGRRLSDSVITLSLWEKHEISSTEKFNLQFFSNSLKDIILKHTMKFKSSQRLKPMHKGNMHKSSLQLLLDENALQASKPKPKLEAQAQSTTGDTKRKTTENTAQSTRHIAAQSPILSTTQKKRSIFDYFRKNGEPTLDTESDTEPTLDIDWLDFAYKSSIDEESLSNDACYVYDTLKDFINRMRTTEAACKIILNIGKVPIIDFSNASLDDLQFLVQLFTGCSVKEAKKYSFGYLLQSLSAYIPFTNTQIPKPPQGNAKLCSSCNSRSFFSKFSFCQYCGKACCSRCILKQHIYRFNLSSLQFICILCSDSLDKQDAELWKEKCLSLIVANDLQSVLAAHGCMAMALCGDIDPNKLLYSVAKKLSQQKFFSFSLEYFTNYLYNCTDTESVKACVAIGSTLQKFADHSNTEYLDTMPILMAANSAYACAQKTRCSIEIPSLDRDIEDVTRRLHDAYNTEKETYVKKAALKLESAWAIRNYCDMISVLLGSNEGFGSHFDDYAMIGLGKFLSTKVKYINTMLSADSAAILFFQGIFKLYKNEHNAGFLDIEKAVWKGYHSEWMPKAAIDVLISMLSWSCNATPHESLHSVLSSLSVTDLFSSKSKCLISLCLNPANLDAPLTLNWPQLGVTGVNPRATLKYEQAAIRLFKEGRWMAKDVALAYIDLIPSCGHSAEVCACFLLAGLWFLKELETIIPMNKLQNQPQIKLVPKIYATKQAAFVCTWLAFCASQEHFHLGMQLYTSRVGLQIVLRAKECAQSCFTKEDSYLLSRLLQVVIQTSRFFPFWDIPIVMACETQLLRILTGELHSEFVLSLQHISPEKHMLFKDHELKYQLYENNLRHLCPLENADEAQLQAMNSMLMEHGWSVEDVSYLMTSPLSPRTPEGWLTQEPKLGVPMEYASIEGFVLDLVNPSLQLIVVKEDKQNVGLVSQNDLRECLQLPNSPLFFSLDPPDEDHRFHPFQAFRYEPKELQGSTLLHTLFETDYLLKSFSVGTEVSSVPPFKQRPCREGLVANLPKDLQNAVRPMSERGQSWSHMQRFWIQVDELVYDESIKNGKLTVKFKKPKMTVCTHPQMIGTDGKLQDTSENVNPDSPEYKFAADVTTCYDEIGKYFPMFARLQEIVKLWYLCLIIQSTLEDFRNKAQGRNLEIPTQLLKEIIEREKQDQFRRVNETLSQALQQYQSNMDYWRRQLSNARLEIVINLLENCKGHGCPTTMESKVDDWLNNFFSAEENLINYICGCIESAIWQVGYHSAQQQLKQQISSLVAEYKSQYLTLKSHCDSQLSQVKPQLVKELTDVFKGNQYTIERLVDQWLHSSSGSNELRNYLYECLPKPSSYDVKKAYQDECQRTFSLISGLVSNLKRPSSTQQKLPSHSCNWVPAALLHTANKSSFLLCYGGVKICPKTIRHPLSVDRKSVYVSVNPSDFRKSSQNSQHTCTGVIKQSNNKCTSIINNNDGTTRFHFDSVLDSSSRCNVSLTQLQLKDRLTNLLQWDSSQRNPSSIIQHPSRPQQNARMQSNTGVHMNAQRAILSSRNRFSQMQMHDKRNSGGKKNHYSSTTSAAAVGAALAAASGGSGDGGGSDDDGSSGTDYVAWKTEAWKNSEQGSHMKSSASAHIQYRGIDYIQMKIDSKIMWISLDPSGYKVNAWEVQKQASNYMKLKLEFQFNANGMKPVKEHKKSE